MSSKNKSQLRTENSSNFPNNNSQFITPEKLRDFNTDMIDSMLINQDSGSYLLTSSFDSGSRNLTFTREDGTTYSNLIPGGGGGAETGSLIITASVVNATITYTKGNGDTFTNTVNNVVSSSYAVSSSRADSSLLADSATSASRADSALLADSATTAISASHAVNADTSISSSQSTNSNTSVSASHAEQADNATSASHAVQADNSTSSSNAISSSVVTDPNIAYINKNNTFTGTQNFDNISVSGTGSFGRINTVTGSAKIIGDAFVVVNADTPTLRYAGLQVYDSGSSNATASIQWDGLNDSWILVEEDGQSSFILTGPTGSLGSEANLSNNSLPKGAVHRQLVDSNISDNGTTITLGSTTNVSGPLSASNLSSIEISNLQTTSSVDRDRINQLSVETGSLQVQINAISGGTGSQNVRLDQLSVETGSLQNEIDGLSSLTGSYAVTNATNLFTEKQLVSGSNGFVEQTFTAPTTNVEKAFFNVSGAEINSTAYNRVFYGMADYPSFGNSYKDYFALEYYNSTGYNYGSEFSLNGLGSRLLTIANGGTGAQLARFQTSDDGDGTTTADIRANTIQIGSTSGTNTSLVIGNGNMITSVSGQTTFNGTTTFAGGVNIIMSGSVQNRVDPQPIISTTASLDFSASSMFELTLVSGSTTHLVPTNANPGQTVNVLIKQPAVGTGSVEFCPEFFQPTGSLYVPSSQTDARDILTMVSFNQASEIYVSNVVRLVNNPY